MPPSASAPLPTPGLSDGRRPPDPGPSPNPGQTPERADTADTEEEVMSPTAAPDRLLPGGDSGHISFGGIVQPPPPGVLAATIGAVGASSLRTPDPARVRP